jgi:hypothetical protein
MKPIWCVLISLFFACTAEQKYPTNTCACDKKEEITEVQVERVFYPINLPDTVEEDSSGNIVTVIPAYNVGPARTYYVHGTFIAINPYFLESKPPEAQLFIYYHELAHIKLKHLSSNTENDVDKIDSEIQADNYALNRLRNRENFSKKDFDVVIKSVEADRKADIIGEKRLNNIKRIIEKY